MPEEYDSYEVSTGLIDHFTGTVIGAMFGIRANYSETNYLMLWTIELDNPGDFPQVESGQMTEQFSIGPEWESLDGGQTVEYPGNPEKKFNGNTQYGQIITRAVEWGMKDRLKAKGPTTNAEIWVGERFEFKAETRRSFKNQAGETVSPGPKIMPVAYLGANTEIQNVPMFDMSSLGLEPDQETELRKVAAESGNYGQFLDGAMKLTWVTGNASMVTALADQSLWQAIKPF